jgi:hypothetical protein
MPRRNKRKIAAHAPHRHALSPNSRDYKQKCRGCAFVGSNAECLTSDGICLKALPLKTREVSGAIFNRRTDTASQMR